jgi:hypothetical protein
MKKVLYFKALHILMDTVPSNLREKKKFINYPEFILGD